jgi:hypothetical protein
MRGVIWHGRLVLGNSAYEGVIQVTDFLGFLGGAGGVGINLALRKGAWLRV